VRVVDSSAIVKYYVREPGWERVREIMKEGVVTLNFAIIEIANALWRKIMRNEMSVDIAKEIVEDLVIRRAIPLEPFENYITEALKISAQHRVTVYDALFIASALKKSLELVTADEKQAEVAKALGVGVVLV
jgi:predicted nucleic acid-binding protein